MKNERVKMDGFKFKKKNSCNVIQFSIFSNLSSTTRCRYMKYLNEREYPIEFY